jgi:predicted NBD/HSP70 family sugar kinase
MADQEREATMKDSPGSLGSLRQRNRLRILDVLRRAGRASRVELVRETGLSRTTVSKLVAELQADGLVVERAETGEGDASGGRATIGRPAVDLTLNPAVGGIVGIDFAHDLVRVAVADLAGVVLAETHGPVDVDNNAVASIDLAARLVDELFCKVDLDLERTVGIGVAVSAPMLATGELASKTILPAWSSLTPGHELERRLGRPVFVGNDANLGALAEVRTGAGRGARDVIYVMLAAGVGSGLVLGGAPYTGHAGVAGELGHVVVDPHGQICRCGNRGCLETIVAGPALMRILRPLHGSDITLEDAIGYALEGDEGCRRLFADAGRAVGRALGASCNLLNPEMVIIGGAMSAVPDVLDGVREGIALSTIPAVRESTVVVPASLGDRAEVLGALGLVLEQIGAGQLHDLVAMSAAGVALTSR